MSPPKVAYLIGSLERGGAEGQLLELLRRLNRALWQPSIILFDDATRERAAGLDCELYSLEIPSSGFANRFRLRGLKAAVATLRLAKYLRKTHPDILHLFLPASFILGIPAATLARVPIVVGSRRSLVDSYRPGGMLSAADRFSTRRCDFVLGNSQSVTDEVVRVDGLARERTATIRNGVDISRFHPGGRDMRTECGWKEDDVVFGVVANFILYKRHSDFIRAAELIGAKAPNARFVMAGEDRGILSGLREQINQAGLDSKFVIIPGTTEPEKLYRAMDVYVCTSATEGLSNVLLEAAASALPIVATRTGGNPEIVRDGENGILVPIESPEKIAQACLTLLGDRGLRRRMGESGRRMVEQEFSLDAMVQGHTDLYNHLLNLRHKGKGNLDDAR